MKEFRHLPQSVKDAVESRIEEEEEIQLFFLAGKPMFSSPDYVFITTERVLIIDIRTIGHLTESYVNVKSDLLFSEIKSVKLNRTFKNKLFRQANLEIDIDGYKHLIKGANCKVAKKALKLISSGMQKCS